MFLYLGRRVCSALVPGTLALDLPYPGRQIEFTFVLVISYLFTKVSLIFLLDSFLLAGLYCCIIFPWLFFS